MLAVKLLSTATLIAGVKFLLGFLIGGVAGLYARSSIKDTRHQKLPPVSLLIFAVAGGLLLIVEGPTLFAQIFYAVALVAIAVIQFTNREGKRRAISWGLFGLIAAGGLIFSTMGRLDAGQLLPGVEVFAIPFFFAIAPILTGTITVLRLELKEIAEGKEDEEEVEEKQEEKAKVGKGRVIAAVACSALAIVVGIWAFL